MHQLFRRGARPRLDLSLRATVAPPVPGQRVFLFLQGPASPFFRRLARALRRAGGAIVKVQLCGGDLAFWPGPALPFRRGLDAWPAFVESVFETHGVTDLVLFGDCRPYHAQAIASARERGVTLHLFEEGYIRPDWMTLEHAGVNAHSDLPRTPDAVRRAHAEDGPAPVPAPVGDLFRNRAAWDVVWALATTVLKPLFPGYRRHTLLSPLAEYPGWVRRWLGRRAILRNDATAQKRLEAARGPCFLLPLQLDGDFQLRVHSRFVSSLDAADELMSSFATHAPADALLLVKRHPFDVGPHDTRAATAALAAGHGLADRVVFFEGGDVGALMARSAGVIVINSTSAMAALSRGKPLKVLGRATYHIAGLVDNGPLDRFWTAPVPPDAGLWAAYRDVVITRTQVNGGFFSRNGMALAVAGCVPRMLAAREAPAAAETPLLRGRGRV